MEGNGIGRGGRRIEAGAARILAADERAAPRKVDSARNGLSKIMYPFVL